MPPLGGGEAPAFASSGACREWLNTLPLANAAQAQAQLLTQLERLNRHALAAGERLQILELLRESSAFVQRECAKKFAARPLPLAEAEAAAFQANCHLWQALCVGYQRCIEACLEGDQELAPQGALVVQRALWALAGEQGDIYRAWQEIPSDFWRKLHAVFAVGEQLAADQQPVRDLLLEARGTTVHGAYIHCLLLHASSPYELSPRQLAQVQRWLARWSGKVKLDKTAPAAFKLPPIVVDVAGDHPGSPRPEPDGNLRWLDVDGLAHTLKRRIVSLQKGETAVALGLGEDCAQPACEQLLKHVYDRCCRGGVARAQIRNTCVGECRLVSGMDQIYFHITGKLFQQPAGLDDLSKRQHEEIALFGQTAKRFDAAQSQAHTQQLETWNIADESAGGLRLWHPASQPGRRLAAGQLLALQPPGGGAGLRLGAVRWITQLSNGDVQAGVRMMPGAPHGISICATGLTSVVGPRCRPGFRLPAVEALHLAATVVFPVGAFRAERIVEILGDTSVQIKLKRIVEHGHDYERAEYEAP